MNLLLESIEGVDMVDLLVELAIVDFQVEVAMVDHQVETMKEDIVYLPVEAMVHFQVEEVAMVDFWVEEVAMVDHQVEVELAIHWPFLS